MGKSYSSVVQEDTSVKTGGDAANVLGSGASQTSASGSLLITAPNTTLGDITMNQFPEAVQDSVAALVNTVDKAVSSSSQNQLASTAALSEKLSQVTLGDTSILPKLALYGLIAVVAVLIGRKALR
jgi:hypothetical protein